MKTRISFIAMVLSLLVIAAGCSTKNSPSGGGGGGGSSSGGSSSDDYFTMPSYVQVETSGGSTTFTMKAKSAWEATADKKWIEINPEEGDRGETDVTITVTAGEQEKGTVTFTVLGAKQKKKTIKVYRGPIPEGEDPEEGSEGGEGGEGEGGESGGSNIGNGIRFRYAEVPFFNEGGSFRGKLISNSKWTVSSDKDWCTVSQDSNEGTSYISISVQDAYGLPEDKATLTFKNENGGTISVRVLRRGVHKYDDTGEINMSNMSKPTKVDGMLPGLFDIGNNQLIAFSKGNLQYHPGKLIWRFAHHQYDYWPPGTFKDHDWDEPEDFIDGFAWGTSGWSGGVKSYGPVMGGEASDYWIQGDYTLDMTGDYANADWGVYNNISNGGNQAGLWRTLEYEEMQYLAYHRPGAFKLTGTATVNDVQGVILLPNNWQMPAGLGTFIPVGFFGGDYSDNVYDKSDWEQMEEAGAVFLPIHGVSGNWAHATYWTASAELHAMQPGQRAYSFIVDHFGISTGASPAKRNDGIWVRLVRDR